MRPVRRARRSLLAAAGSLLILAGLLPVAAAPVVLGATPVFINEIHYDNAGADAGEAIEVAGPAGTNLTGWSIVLYNGSGGASYDTDALSGTIPDSGNGFGAVHLSYPSNGIQNGAPDGVALVGPSSTVVQFLSYEGSFTATGGPANGLTSVDIGVSEAGTEAIGLSLGLTGTGSSSEDFSWSTGLAASFGQPNPGQAFIEGAPEVSTTLPADGATGVAPGASVSITFSEPVDVTGSWFDLTCDTSGTHTASVSGGPTTFTLDPDTDFAADETCTLTVVAAQVTDQDADDPPDQMAADHVVSFATAAAVVPGVVISEVYGGGGNSGATFKNDFIELYNPTAAAVDLTGWSVQYASASGTTWQVTSLTGSIPAGRNYLVQEAAGTGGTVDLPTPDATGSIPMSGTNGKVALVSSTIPLSGACPAGSPVVDLVGYGTASCFEGTGPTAALMNTTSAQRKGGGATDTNDNATDFDIAAPDPRASVDPAPRLVASTPANNSFGASSASSVSLTFNEPVTVAGDWFSIDCATSGHHAATASGGPLTFSLDPATDFVPGEACVVTVLAAGVTDQDTDDPPDAMAADASITFATEVVERSIHDIQGAAHRSPYENVGVTTSGIVTATVPNGLYVQEPAADADVATSEAIFVFTSAAPTASVGDAVRITGLVTEFRAGGSGGLANLTLTEFSNPSLTVTSSGNPLPAPVVVGTGGRVPPGAVIDDDATGDVETSGSFDAATDGIDFFESLEAMRVQVNDPVATGPTNGFGEISVVGDGGANASLRTARGGIVVRADDFNPERIIVDDTIQPTPDVNVGDGFAGPAVGVLDYSFGNVKLFITEPLARVDNGLQREVTEAPGAKELAVATFNVENLDANEPQAKFDALAGQIVDHLLAPDIVALEEIQDNNGATNDATVAANLTLDRLVAAIAAAGGPTYAYRQIDPADDQDGGEPGGNIRVGFLFRADRGVAFVDRPGGDATTATTVVDGPAGPQLSLSPGRVDPANAAWTASRKPLAGEFTFRGQTFFVIVNHFNSKGGDQPLFGRFQPPVRSSEVQRHQQAQIVNDFVDDILALDPDANVVVLGDINDFEFSETVSILKGGVLHDLIETLPPDERYSYVFDGNSQVLDHILVSDGLAAGMPAFDPVHVNAEFHDQLSDHDPSVARFLVNTAPTVDAGGPYSVVEGQSVTVSATGSDAEGDAITYAWDLDGDGSFETPGQSVEFSAAPNSAPSSPTIRVRASDGTAAGTDVATVHVIWSFSGFLPPLGPDDNRATAGSTIPVKFRLGGDQGLSVLAAGYPASVPFPCGSTPPADASEPTSSVGGGLRYDPATDTYAYNWKTSKAWSGTCRRLVVELVDGTVHYADVTFVR